MAKYTSSLVNDMRGKLGGIVGSANASGNFLRKSNMPIDPRKPVQTQKRWLVQYVSQNWRTITTVQQAQWKALGLLLPKVNSLGKTYYMTGFQTFMFCNLNLITNGYPVRTFPLDVSGNNFPDETGWLVDVVTTPGSEQIKINFPNPIRLGEAMIIESTGVVSNGINYPKNFKQIAVLDDTSITPSFIKDPYVAVFGSMPLTGNAVWFRIHFITTSGGFCSSRMISQSIGHV